MTEFNLLAFAQGKSRAETSIDLYFNEDAGRRAGLATKFTEGPNPERYVVDREAFDAARAEIEASKVTIHLQGLDEGRIDEIRADHALKPGTEYDKQLDDPDFEKYLIDVLAETYVKAVDAEGNEDTSAVVTEVTEESIAAAREYWTAFKRSVPSSQWPKLLQEVVNIIFVSFILDTAVDAGFLADSSLDQKTPLS